MVSYHDDSTHQYDRDLMAQVYRKKKGLPVENKMVRNLIKKDE